MDKDNIICVSACVKYRSNLSAADEIVFILALDDWDIWYGDDMIRNAYQASTS